MNEISNCLLCGGRAFVTHDIFDEYDFGWSIGCARAKIGDKYHNLNDYDSFHNARITFYGLNNKEQAIKIWEKRCKE